MRRVLLIPGQVEPAPYLGLDVGDFTPGELKLAQRDLNQRGTEVSRAAATEPEQNGSEASPWPASGNAGSPAPRAAG